MKKIKNLTAAEILKQIKLTVICGEEITESNVCDGFSTWMEQFDASNPYEAFTPESREYFQNKLFVAFAAGMLPAEVTETRTNEVGPDGCWVFTVETAGQLDPYEETEETEETTAPADEQTTETETVTLDTAETACVWNEDGETVTTETEEEEEEETMTTANELQKYVDSIADDLQKLYEADLTDEEREAAEESGEACDLYSYFADVLDIEYTISSRGDFLGARIAVTLGGPNIYIDTREGEVKGYWGTDRATRWIPSDICEEINSIMEEYYDMVRGA